MTEATIKLAASIYEKRDWARRILGKRYHAEMDRLSKRIRSKMAMDNLSEIQAAYAICKTLEAMYGDESHTAVAMIVAAAAEMIEPTARQSG